MVPSSAQGGSPYPHMALRPRSHRLHFGSRASMVFCPSLACRDRITVPYGSIRSEPCIPTHTYLRSHVRPPPIETTDASVAAAGRAGRLWKALGSTVAVIPELQHRQCVQYPGQGSWRLEEHEAGRSIPPRPATHLRLSLCRICADLGWHGSSCPSRSLHGYLPTPDLP